VRQVALTTVLVGAALAVAACASTQSGQASPSGGQSAPTTRLSSSNPSTNSGLTGVNACSLLTDAEAQQVVSGVAGHEDQGDLGGPGTSNCRWSRPTTNDQAGIVFSITVRPTQSIQEIKPDPNRPGATVLDTTTTGGRQAVVLKNDEGQGSCAVSIAVGSGRVDIDGQTGTTDDACAVDSKISDFVEPKLPKV
jgi:hypothetical protein